MKSAFLFSTVHTNYFKINVTVPKKGCEERLFSEGFGLFSYKDSGLISAHVRTSHQVYNETEDYERFRDAMTEMVKDQMTCQNFPY